jgi:hypothetical protein
MKPELTAHQKLFDYFYEQHNVLLLEQDIAEIENILKPDAALIAALKELITIAEELQMLSGEFLNDEPFQSKIDSAIERAKALQKEQTPQ